MIPTYIEYLRRQQKALRDELSRVGDLLAQLSKQGATTQTQVPAPTAHTATMIVGGMSSTLAVGPNDAEAAK
jgi:hypothetical protein